LLLTSWGNNDLDASTAIVDAALDAGINLVDTADFYAAGESETVVGHALKGRRDRVVLTTKVHMPMGDDPNQRGNSRRWIVRECEASLRRLQTDWIDVYQLHRPDPDTDLDETLGALTDLVRQGKARAIGTSTFPPSQIVEAQWIAERRGRERPSCEQPPYSMLTRGIEREVLPVCARHGLGVLTYSPLAGGWLSGKWRKNARDLTSHRARRMPVPYDLSIPANQRKLEAADALAVLADDAGITLVHLAVAWVLQHPAVTSVILGPRTLEQLQTQLGAADVRLSKDVLDEIDRIVEPGTNFTWSDSGYIPPEIVHAKLRRR
jgi:aryl-alcohol dehydrogenase-like predicted oxidoreductase